MSSPSPPYKPMVELAELVRNGKISPTELTNANLERIERYDDVLKRIRAVLSVLRLPFPSLDQQNPRYRRPCHGRCG